MAIARTPSTTGSWNAGRSVRAFQLRRRSNSRMSARGPAGVGVAIDTWCAFNYKPRKTQKTRTTRGKRRVSRVTSKTRIGQGPPSYHRLRADDHSAITVEAPRTGCTLRPALGRETRSSDLSSTPRSAARDPMSCLSADLLSSRSSHSHSLSKRGTWSSGNHPKPSRPSERAQANRCSPCCPWPALIDAATALSLGSRALRWMYSALGRAPIPLTA